MSSKICTKCSVEKPLSEYHNNKQYKHSQCKTCVKEYRRKNPHLQTKWRRKWKENGGITKYREYQNNYKLKPLTKATSSLRARLATIVRLGGYKKKSSLNKIIGCDWNTLKQHLEGQFNDKMNWANYGDYWEIDHILPLASAKTIDEIYELSHYTNLQPLYWKDNRKKSAKII